jgi:hypothetical protein
MRGQVFPWPLLKYTVIFGFAGWFSLPHRILDVAHYFIANCSGFLCQNQEIKRGILRVDGKLELIEGIGWILRNTIAEQLLTTLAQL